ncbi:MAG: DoxX family protein [Fimbriimonadaceae bacterium]
MADSDARVLGICLLLMRVVVGVIMIYYGVQNVFALMGGDGFTSSSQQFADVFGAELYVGQAAMVGQLAAGVLLVLGLFTRYAATVIGALAFVVAVQGAPESLVRTTSADPLAAVGFPTCLVVMSFVLIFLGGGLLSLDARMQTRRRKAKVAQLS